MREVTSMNKETSMALIANAIAIIVAIQSLINTSITSLTIIFLVIGIFVSLFIIFSKKY